MIQHRAARFVLNQPWRRNVRDSISSLLLLLLLLLMDKNCLAVQDCQARPQAFESAHILLFSMNHQDSS